MIQRFYFTFGQGHESKLGVPMADYYVEVYASSWDEARDMFVQDFTKQVMPAPNKWASQYTEQTFEPHWYPKGPATRLPADTDTVTRFNCRMHIRSYENLGYFENHYDVFTRDEVVAMIQRLQRKGMKSHCEYRLDGSIRIHLISDAEHVSGHFNAHRINFIKKAPSHGPQPEPGNPE